MRSKSFFLTSLAAGRGIARPACGRAEAAEQMALDHELLYPTRAEAVQEGLARLRAADASPLTIAEAGPDA